MIIYRLNSPKLRRFQVRKKRSASSRSDVNSIVLEMSSGRSAGLATESSSETRKPRKYAS
jgi:hypothetical protein